jgi:chitodextrinase
LSSLILLLTAQAVVGSPTAAHAVQYPHSQVVSQKPAAWTPWVQNGWVSALAQVGTKMIAGGSFSSVQEFGTSTSLSRTNLFSFDATTGVIDPDFHPTLDGVVNALQAAPDGQSVFVGGRFHTVNGQTRNVLTELSVSTGAIVPGFTTRVSGGPVADMVVRGTTLYVGGGFTRVNGVTRPYLAAVDATTGALDTGLAPVITGTFNGGTTSVDGLDVTPDGSSMVVVGNFTAIDGQDRTQIAQFDLTSAPNILADWETNRLKPLCLSRFTSYPEDVDYSPDGSYFVLATTGAFMGGFNAGVLCDTVSRWETNSVGSALQPTWIDYAGGDTQTAIAVTSVAVYTSGHMRWENDPYGGDQAGPGAVARQGLAALDPINGLPLPWNPSRSIANGSWRGTLLATSEGLWIGTDVTSIAHQTHRRLAFFPLDGGTTIPPADPGTLPGTLFSLASKTCPSADPSILYRVNAGGPALPSSDCGPDWGGDTSGSPSPLHNGGSNTATWGPVGSVDPTVPASTPPAVFESERWSPSDSPPMEWTFPVPAGTNVAVRLYFANQYPGTSQVGERVFTVSIDGQDVLTNYDIVADVGDRVGTTKTFNVTSLGTITVTTQHVVENPLLNAVEIVDLDATPVHPVPQTYLVSRTFDGITAGSPTNLQTPTIDWSQGRGAFMLSGTLYYGWQDGNLYSRKFDGTTLGAATLLNPYVIGPGPVFSGVTGAFYSNGYLYYAVKDDPTMHARYFQPEAGILGAVQFDVPSNGFDWSQATGLTMANDRLYWATPDENLHSAVFAGNAPQPGTGSIISGPATGDGQQWGGSGMFVLSTLASHDTEAPTAPSDLHATWVAATQVDLAWGPSTDNIGVSSYEIYRDGSPLATVEGTQTTYPDASAAPDTSYAYKVFAKDAAGNVSDPSNQLNVTTPTGAVAFSDDFETGDLSNWSSSTGMSVQSVDVHTGTYAALASASGDRAYARVTLPGTYPSLSTDAAFKVVSQGANSVNLLRFQTDAGANIATLFVSSTGRLMLRNDVGATNVSSSTVVSTGSWHQVEVRLAISGASSTVQVLLDGSQVTALSTTLNLGTNPIGRLNLGDNNTGRTFQVVYDDVVAT